MSRPAWPRGWPSSLRLRLLLATVGALALALGLAGAMLSRLFDEQVTRQFAKALTVDSAFLGTSQVASLNSTSFHSMEFSAAISSSRVCVN